VSGGETRLSIMVSSKEPLVLPVATAATAAILV
jgi:hypothetical protein